MIAYPTGATWKVDRTRLTGRLTVYMLWPSEVSTQDIVLLPPFVDKQRRQAEKKRALWGVAGFCFYGSFSKSSTHDDFASHERIPIRSLIIPNRSTRRP